MKPSLILGISSRMKIWINHEDGRFKSRSFQQRGGKEKNSIPEGIRTQRQLQMEIKMSTAKSERSAAIPEI